MKARIIGVVALFAALIGGLAFAAGGSTASGTKPDSEGSHKVYVCHATSGEGELKNGYNLIEVDVASTQYKAHQAHATTDPKQNSKFGTLYDYIDVDPNNLPGKCGDPEDVTTTEPDECYEGCDTTVPDTTEPEDTTPDTTPDTTEPEDTTTTTVVVVTTTTPPPPPPPPPATTLPGLPSTL